MARARRYMVRGLTSGWGYHRPYPLVGKRGEGPYLIDLDDNRYVDLANNGLSLIHGHAFPPVVEALRAAAGARLRLARPLRGADRVRPDAVRADRGLRARALHQLRHRVRACSRSKVARAFTGRPAVLKSDRRLPRLLRRSRGRPVRAAPRSPAACTSRRSATPRRSKRKLTEHGEQIAAVVLEPLLFSGLVTTAPPGFLRRVQDAAQRAGRAVRARRLPDAAPRLWRLAPSSTG